MQKCDISSPQVHNTSRTESKNNKVDEMLVKEFKNLIYKIINELKDNINKLGWEGLRWQMAFLASARP
jgi:hypothetical protein